jgi:hypothetical protein
LRNNLLQDLEHVQGAEVKGDMRLCVLGASDSRQKLSENSAQPSAIGWLIGKSSMSLGMVASLKCTPNSS